MTVNDPKKVGHVGGHHRVHAVALMAGALIAASSGCAARTMEITIPGVLNTEMHSNRKCEDRTGERLAVDIVCVLPRDLEKPENRALRPDSHITSKIWFEKRPETGSSLGGRFDLPPNQVYHLTDKKNAYGTIFRERLVGVKDGNQVVKIKGIKFPKSSKLHDSDSVIYVFPKFIDADGHVLETKPVMFNSPGDYHKELSVELGVEDPCGEARQYIKNTTKKQK